MKLDADNPYHQFAFAKKIVDWLKTGVEKQTGHPLTQNEWVGWILNYQQTHPNDWANLESPSASQAILKGCVLIIEERPR